MSSKFTTEAITLKSYSLGESDKIIVMYSKDKGLLRCVAKGVKKPSCRLGSCVDNLIASKFLISNGRKLDVISQSEGVNSFGAIRKDFTKLSYAMYCADVVNAFAVEDDIDSSDLYEVFYNSLDAINKAKSISNTMLCVLKFQLNLMDALGYGVELDECVKCSEKPNQNTMFCSDSGGIICDSCSSYVSGKSFSSKLITFIKKVKMADFSSKYFHDEEIKNELTVKFCFNLMKDYITKKSPKKLKAQEFLEMAQ